MFCQTHFCPSEILTPDTGEEPYEIASGDLDGDGDIDMVMATYDLVVPKDFIKWYKNDGGNLTNCNPFHQI